LQMCALNQSGEQQSPARAANVAAPQPAPTAQASTQQTAAVQPNPAPPVVTHPPASYENKPSPPPPAREITGTKSRGARTLSIASSEEENKDEPLEMAILDTPFTQEELQKVWDEFPEKYQQVSPSFLAAMKRYSVRKGEGNTICFEADNPLIFSDKMNFNTLLDYLKTSLKNNQIVIESVIREIPDAEKLAFTDKEKLEKLIELRPMLQLFKDELGLEADS